MIQLDIPEPKKPTSRRSAAILQKPFRGSRGHPRHNSGKGGQKVHIEYDLLDVIPVDERMKAEQA